MHAHGEHNLKYCVKISYPKGKGQGHQRGQGHSKNKKCGKFDETCEELKISFSKFPYKFDIFGGLSHFWLQWSAGAVYVGVELAQPMRKLNTTFIQQIEFSKHYISKIL